jgi:two-component system, cell cycle sensor histidine kinase and response regulator CckA
MTSENGKSPKNAATEGINKQKEKRTLQKARQGYELLAKYSRDIILFVRRDDARIVEVNEAAIRAYGYTRDELLSCTIPDLTPPDTEMSHIEPQEGLQPGGVFESVQRRKDATTFPVEISSRQVEFDGQQVIINIIRDISDRKNAESALREAHQLNRQLLNSVHEGVVVVDPDLRYLRWNNYMENFTGYKEKDLLGRNALDIFPFMAENDILGNIKKALAGEHPEPISYSYSLPALDLEGWASEIHSPLLNEAGKVVGVISTFRDVTAEMHRQERDEALRALISSLPDIVSRFDLNFRHQYISDNIEDITNLRPEHCIGKTHRELGFPEEHCRFWEKAIRYVFDTGKQYEVEFAFDLEQGRKFYDWRFVPEFNRQRAVQSVLSVGRDVTTARRAEENYHTLFNEMRNGFMLNEAIYNDAGVPIDFRYLAVNPAFERMSGLKGESLLGKSALEVFPNREPGWMDYYTKVVLTGEPVSFEDYRSEIRKYFMVSVFRPAPNQFACIFEDITERKKAEITTGIMKRSIDLASDAAFWTDSEGRFIYINDAACKSVGYSRGELMNMHISIVSPGVSGNWNERWGQIREKGTVQFETVHRRKDGTEFPVEVTSTYVDLDGQSYICAFARDIAERKRAEEEKAKLTEQLLQAQKMESIGRLAGGVAHDFNNMLGVILGHAEIALEELDPEHPIYADLTEILKAGRRSADLTRQLLAFARKQTVQPRILNLNETIAGMSRMLERLIGENIVLDWRPGKSLWPIKMDPSQLDQILANLCVNSRDAITGTGRIMLETDNVSLDMEYTASHPGSIPGDYVRLIVKDNGSGMESNIISQIFEPFFTTKNVGLGTGLGLATTYGIVKQNSGYIDVYSEPGQGTAFFIFLPRHTEIDAEGLEASTEPIKGNNQTILLVEDEPAILRLTARMLKQQGYSVLPAHSPGEAIQIARKYDGDIHVLVTDMILPEMNGRELADSLMKIYPSIKRLFISGYTANVIAHQGVLEAGIHFLQKPYNSKELTAKLQEVLSAKQKGF